MTSINSDHDFTVPPSHDFWFDASLNFPLLKLTILFFLKCNYCCTCVCANQIFLKPPLLLWKQDFNYMAERHFAGATKARSGWLI